MFWCHNRSLLNVYDVETVIITHQHPTDSFGLVQHGTKHTLLTMENMRRALWRYHPPHTLNSIRFNSSQLHELSQFGDWERVEEYIFFVVVSIFFCILSIFFLFVPFDVFVRQRTKQLNKKKIKKWISSESCVCKIPYTQFSHSIWTWNWTTVHSHNLRNVHVGKQI